MIPLVQQPSGNRRERLTGKTTTLRWHGGEAECNAKADALQGEFELVTVDHVAGEVYEVTASGKFESEIANQWELLGSMQAEPLSEHPSFIALKATVPAQYEKLLKLARQSADPTSTEFADSVFTDATALAFANLLKRNQDSYQTPVWVLKHTANLWVQAEIQISMAGIGQVWTTAQVQPLFASFQAINDAIDEIPALTERTGYTAGWLKQTPQIDETLRGTVRVTEEWWYNSWNNVLYPAFTLAP